MAIEPETLPSLATPGTQTDHLIESQSVLITTPLVHSSLCLVCQWRTVKLHFLAQSFQASSPVWAVYKFSKKEKAMILNSLNDS